MSKNVNIWGMQHCLFSWNHTVFTYNGNHEKYKFKYYYILVMHNYNFFEVHSSTKMESQYRIQNFKFNFVTRSFKLNSKLSSQGIFPWNVCATSVQIFFFSDFSNKSNFVKLVVDCHRNISISVQRQIRRK